MIPKESAWFGYYKDGSTEEILPAQEVEALYNLLDRLHKSTFEKI